MRLKFDPKKDPTVLYLDREQEHGMAQRYQDFYYGTRQVISVALEQVNQIRIAIGIGEGKIPKFEKAVPGDPKMCVLARALSNGWQGIVSSDRTLIRHPHTEGQTVDFDAIKTTLVGLGFQNVIVKHWKNSSTVSFQNTCAMNELIERFDNYEIPGLVLKDDRG